VYTIQTWPFIYETIDGGGNWIADSTPTVCCADALHFINADTGFIGGFSGEMFKTTDGGANWNLVFQDQVTINEIYDIACPTDSICYARTSSPSRVLKSMDGGDTWYFLSAAPNTIFTGGMHALNEDTIVLVTNDSKIFRTTDGGVSWPTVPSPTSADYRDVFFIDNIGFAVGAHETIIKSIDYGETWTTENQDTSSSEIILAIHMHNSLAIASSHLGSIYRQMFFSNIEKSPFTQSISVFPNPFKKEITVDFDGSKSGEIYILNLLGQTIQKIEITNQEVSTLDLGFIQSDIIILKFIEKESGLVVIKKLMKVN